MTRLPVLLLGLAIVVYCWSYFAGQHRGDIFSTATVPVRDSELWELNPR